MKSVAILFALVAIATGKNIPHRSKKFTVLKFKSTAENLGLRAQLCCSSNSGVVASLTQALVVAALSSGSQADCKAQVDATYLVSVIALSNCFGISIGDAYKTMAGTYTTNTQCYSSVVPQIQTLFNQTYTECSAAFPP